jgi:hypothetical protein
MALGGHLKDILNIGRLAKARGKRKGRIYRTRLTGSAAQLRNAGQNVQAYIGVIQ